MVFSRFSFSVRFLFFCGNNLCAFHSHRHHFGNQPHLYVIPNKCKSHIHPPKIRTIWYSATVRLAHHTTKHANDIVTPAVDADLGGGDAEDGVGGEDELEDGRVDSGEVARTRRLVFLGTQGERVDVDTRVRVAGMVLPRLDDVEV